MSESTEPSGRRPGRQPRSDATRDAIIEAALRIMESDGEDSIRVARVAQDAGVTTGALYAHFVDREDLIGAAHIEFMRRAVSKVYDRGSRLIDDSTDPLDIDTNRTYISELLSAEAMAERRRWAEAAVAGHRNPQLKKRLSDVMRELIGRSADMVRKSQEAGWVDAELDPDAIAVVQLATTVGLSLFADLLDEDPQFRGQLVEVWSRLPRAMSPNEAPSNGD